jgi:uncharacterized membrane protein YcaP (DUF421 family)
MKKEEIHFGDIKRWLFGQAPPEFMIEVAIRTGLIYLFLLLVVKLMGKRMTGQMTNNELAVMLTLGAIVSPVMQLPDRGMFFGVVVLLCALAFQRGINYFEVINPAVESVTQGDGVVLVKDGTLNLEELEKSQISKQQLFAMLREKKVQNLARVERAYLEACGILSVYETDKTMAGLPILPPSDPLILSTQKQLDENIMACCSCGHVQQVSDKKMPCNVCHSKEWSSAFLIN